MNDEQSGGFSADALERAAIDRDAMEAVDTALLIGVDGPDEDDENDPAYDEAPPWLEGAQAKQQLVQVEVSPVNLLLAKLDNWLLQQPEWLVILSAPRATRRKAITLISKHLLTYPARGRSFGGFTP